MAHKMAKVCARSRAPSLIRRAQGSTLESVVADSISSLFTTIQAKQRLRESTYTKPIADLRGHQVELLIHHRSTNVHAAWCRGTVRTGHSATGRVRGQEPFRDRGRYLRHDLGFRFRLVDFSTLGAVL